MVPLLYECECVELSVKVVKMISHNVHTYNVSVLYECQCA